MISKREPLVIALVNNMPDAALRTTEQQFRQLLGAAADGEHELRLRLFSFPELIRSDEGRAYVAHRYEPIAQLWNGVFDGLIVTGAEPRAAALPDEVYWSSLTRLVEWAMASGTPAVWSCLAAHAAVLWLHGIQRRRLDEKISGIFRCTRIRDDPLLAEMPAYWHLPHSRLNTLDWAQLARSGYEILSCSEEAGVDAFLLRERACFVFYQGHPEYDPGALFREYRRDVGRFLTGAMDRYPEMPRRYFDESTASALNVFRMRAERERTPALLEQFPAGGTSERPPRSWHDVAARLYHNWLTNIVAERRAAATTVDDRPIPPVAALFPPRAERVRWDDYLTRELLAANERVARGSVVPTADMNALRAQLASVDFTTPRPLAELLPWTIAQLENGVVHMTNPRYFGLFNPSPTFPALCGDRLTSAFNPQLATATTSPAAVEIEAHVIRAVARRAGLPAESTGHFTCGGSEANFTALLCALTHANEQFAIDGVRAFAGPPVFYISRESHLAWVKIAHEAGIGRSAVRQVPTDGSGRMNTDALEGMLDDDADDGRVPILIVATAGTTNAGMIDPITRCADLARDRGLWLHVDAAWGGAVIASDSLRHVLAGIERADSVTIDAHKWFATTMGCGMFLTRHPAILPATFQVATGFMPSYSVSVDPYVTTAQWSRRFLGVRLFLSLAAAGWRGYAQHVERAVDLIRHARELLVDGGWQIANDSSLAVVCVEPPASAPDVRTIASHVLASGRAWVAVARYEGRDVIRICATHGEATPDDVRELVEALADACAAAPHECVTA